MNTSIKKIFMALIMFMALAINLSATPIKEEEEDLMPTYGSLRGASRFLAQHSSGLLKCNKNPRLCRARGSPGPDCCKKKCVNVKTDKQNCGLCGKKCKHQEICCKGKCVNVMKDKRHCGGCDNRCKKGNTCVYGMCSYA
ncbi:stigma-specific STIG1-like protein 1 [Tanacetum coccineum]